MAWRKRYRRNPGGGAVVPGVPNLVTAAVAGAGVMWWVGYQKAKKAEAAEAARLAALSRPFQNMSSL